MQVNKPSKKKGKRLELLGGCVAPVPDIPGSK